MIWLTLAGMALVTYATRVIPFLSMGRQPAPWLERALRYVPPAIFASLIVPALLAPAGQLAAGPPLWAGLIGLVVAWRTKHMALTVGAGLAALALFRMLG
jgi:branched-subunit amino acid transport protein